MTLAQLYAQLALRYGWPPSEIDRLSLPRALMFVKVIPTPAGPIEDDWSQFGLRCEEGRIKGSNSALQRYAAWKQQQREAAEA